MKSHYALTSRWDVACGREELWQVLQDLLSTDDPVVWWPSVRTVAYDGDVLRLRAASRFGYAVRFDLTDLVSSPPDRLSFRARGDLRGAGDVTFVDVSRSGSALDIEWRVSVDRPWMRRTSWLLRPLFVAGHHLLMRQGQRHLNAWLASRGGRASMR